VSVRVRGASPLAGAAPRERPAAAAPPPPPPPPLQMPSEFGGSGV